MENLNPTKNNEIEKIKIKHLDIIVTGYLDNPYYEIKYLPIDGEYHIGYGSYDLKTVYKWSKECFKII